ncbi:MAG: hypothetical protein QNK23_18070 [Crocinitomicaceae bacterium]|nr:hypothetical protein [Crocinitomicaceae bacterium]
MAKLKANKRRLIQWKVYFDRSRMYIGYIQFFMIGFILLSSNADTAIGKLIFDHLLISIPVLGLLFVGGSLFLGRLDTVYGLREEELRNSAAANPVMREILTNLKEVKAELAELKAKSS